MRPAGCWRCIRVCNRNYIGRICTLMYVNSEICRSAESVLRRSQRIVSGLGCLAFGGCLGEVMSEYVEVRVEVVGLIKQTGVSNKDFKFFSDEAEFMRTAAKPGTSRSEGLPQGCCWSLGDPSERRIPSRDAEAGVAPMQPGSAFLSESTASLPVRNSV